LAVIFAVFPARTEDFRPPAGNRYAQIATDGSVLPGGRLLKPFGVQIPTGPGPFAIAVGPKGSVATADIGFDHFGITFLDSSGKQPLQSRHLWARTPHSLIPELADPDWKGVSAGIVFDSPKSLWISEGSSGRLRQIDLNTGDHKKIVNLNTDGLQNSFITDLAWSATRRLLFAVDRANARLVVIDARGWRIVSSIFTGPHPLALALSPDGNLVYVSEADAICFIDVHDPLKPAISGRVPAPSPQALLATDDRVFASNALNDSITVISVSALKPITEIKLYIPSLEKFHGIVPAGMAWDPLTKWLLVAESGINAIGVVDTEKNELIGHLPAGLMPTRVAIAGDRVYVANAEGRGSGPNPRRAILELGEPPVLHAGTLSTFIMPGREEVMRETGTFFLYAGLVPYMKDIPHPPPAIQHVVLIVKGSQSFDQVLGDLGSTRAATVAAAPALARFGMHGQVSGGKLQFSFHDAHITPNQHALASRWAFSDNFYTNGDTAAESDIWLQHALPDPATEIALRANSDAALLDAGSDIDRADRFIKEIDERYGKGSQPLPDLIVIHLPGDTPRDPAPQKGYPYEASSVAANDFATGKIVAWLSHSPWWRNMTVFITEHDTEGSIDHIDSHRTLLLAAGPWVKKTSVTHINSDVPGLYRTIAEILGVAPRNLTEATASSLRDIFTNTPDFTPYDAIEPDHRIFDPSPVL
jgi:hypothetical protein